MALFLRHAALLWRRRFALLKRGRAGRRTLTIEGGSDYLIAADLPGKSMAGRQELYNVIKKEGIKNLIYMGVHENSEPTSHPPVASIRAEPLGAVGCDLIFLRHTHNDDTYAQQHGTHTHTHVLPHLSSGCSSALR